MAQWIKWLQGRWFLVLLIGFTVFMIFGPLGFLAAGSLRTAPPGAPGTWTLQGYADVVNARSMVAFKNTFVIAIIVAILSTGLGTVLAWLHTRTDLPYKSAFYLMTVIPFFISPVLLSMAWIMLANPSNGLLNFVAEKVPWLIPFGGPLNIYSIPGIIWVELIFYTPYAYLFVVGPMQSLDPSLEEAAVMSGAGRTRVLRTVTFPLLAPAVVSALFVILVRSAELFAVPLLLGYQAGIEVIASLMYNLLEFYPPNHALAGALGLTLIGIMFVLEVVRRRMLGRRKYYTVTGKGYRPRLTQLGKWKPILAIGFGISAVIGVVMPLGVILLASFLTFYNPDMNRSMFTLRNYRRVLLENSMTENAITNTIMVGVVGALVGMLVAVVLGFIIARNRNRMTEALDTIVNMPLALPAVVMGVAMLWFFVHWPRIFYGTVLTLGLAFVVRFLGYGVRSVTGGLSQIHPELEESSRTLGGSWTHTMRKITLPLLKPAIFSGWVLLVATFMRELALVLFLYRPGAETLSIAVYQLWHGGHLPQAAALTVVQVALVAAVVALGRKLAGVKLGVGG